ncbi:LysM domain-containing protein [Cytobacillus praedii]|uniref:LysM peptidoglycan-binding domain-containing protein n=1 Tax=Cytobacillus praedii TaxID=1742358 RepID=UPI002E23C07A|nr:LysM domain-containing protein [Cytobacillus praedii]
MIKNIKVEITIKDIQLDRYHRIPVLPTSIQYTNGDTTAKSFKIVDLGDIEAPDGKSIDSFGWSSEFPAQYDPGYVVISQAGLKKPLDYKNLFEGIKARKAPVQVICPVMGINKTMYIASFVPEFKGMGDIYYAISFRELVTVKPRKLTVAGTAPKKGKKAPSERSKLPEKPKPKTYTVVQGDSLTKIAKKLKLSNWRSDLYEPNKGVIGQNPDRIKPGQVLKL